MSKLLSPLRRHVTLSLFLSASLALLGARSAAAEPIKVGILAFTSHSPSMIARHKGFFDAADLQVEFVKFQAAQPMAVAIASGDIDFGMTAISGGLINLAAKGAVKVIGGALQESDDVGGQKILVSKAAYEKGMTTPAKLAGARYAVTTAGSSFHYMAHKIADGAGFERSSLHITPLQKVPAVIAALKTGQVDAWSIVPNIAAAISKGGDVVEIGKVADYVKDYQVTTVFTSSKHAAEHGALVRRFLKAFSQGVDVYNAAFVDKTLDQAGTDEVVGIVHQYVYSDQPLDKAAPRIMAGAMRISPNARLNLGSVADQLEWFKSEKLVPATVKIDDIVDPQYVETY